MQTGEGKTPAAVPTVAWLAKERKGVHVMTVNDYLACRDARWMGDVYRLLGLSVDYVQRGMTPAQRRTAYGCDITYATANEIGFDVLRDRLALRLDEQVHRNFFAAVVDEVDSILIDEARIPLVIAGGDSDGAALAYVADKVVRRFRFSAHYTVDGARTTQLLQTPASGKWNARSAVAIFSRKETSGFTRLCRMPSKPTLCFAATWITWLRAGPSRRWMSSKDASLSTAVGPLDCKPPWEAKEGVVPKPQGMVLGSTTMQHLIALYPRVCGMTGTAATQTSEFQRVYGLHVEVIPTVL